MREPFVKRLLPRSLLGRSLLIIVAPLVLVQVVAAFVFFADHWDKVTTRLARNLAGDIAAVVELMRVFADPDDRQWISALASSTMGLRVAVREGEILPNAVDPSGGRIDDILSQSVAEIVNRPFQVDTSAPDRDILVLVQTPEGVIEFAATRKRLFSTTTDVFVLWMVGTSLLLLGVATIFMRNQVKPVRRLAEAADLLGKGRDVEQFKPEGAREVRRAAAAFLAMRDRIRRQIAQRTEMLAGVSHDLRTPLTRMKLQLAMLGGQPGVEDLKRDVAEMETMLEGYLAFARGEGGEAPEITDVGALLGSVVEAARRKGETTIDLHTEGTIALPLKRQAFRRCLTNLVENAVRYSRHVSVRAGLRGEMLEIVVDDDGPGIPADKREDVFRPFFRLEGSRNPGTGGVGLGMTIARDVVRGHGGDIVLAESPMGGLRARLVVPL